MTAQLAILGLLVEQPLHGYAIEQVIRSRGMRKWTPIGFSSIYHILEQLVDEGWVQVHVEPAPGRGKERRVHRVTDAGRRHWETDALAALADEGSDPGAFLMGLSGLPQLPRSAFEEALERRVAGLEARVEDLGRDLEDAGFVPPHVEAMFDFVASRLASERDWTRRYLDRLTEPQEDAP